MQLDPQGQLDLHAIVQGRVLRAALPPSSGIHFMFLHWRVSAYTGRDCAYNILVGLENGQWVPSIQTSPLLNATEPPQDGYAAHTYRRNGNAIGISVDAMLGATTTDFGQYAIQVHETHVMCAAAAAAALVYNIDVQAMVADPHGWAPGPIHTTMSHSEAAIITPGDTAPHYFCAPVNGVDGDSDCRWDWGLFDPSQAPLSVETAMACGDVLRGYIHRYKLAIT